MDAISYKVQIRVIYLWKNAYAYLKFFFSFNWSETNSYQVPFLDSALLFFYIIYNFMCSSDLTI